MFTIGIIFVLAGYRFSRDLQAIEQHPAQCRQHLQGTLGQYGCVWVS